MLEEYWYIFFKSSENLKEFDFKEALFELIILILDNFQPSKKEIIINIEELKNKLLT